MSEIQQRTLGDLVVRIERGTCIGSGNCVDLAPETFALDDRQIVTFRDGAGATEREQLLEACRACPVEALVVLGADGTQQVP